MSSLNTSLMISFYFLLSSNKLRTSRIKTIKHASRLMGWSNDHTVVDPTRVLVGVCRYVCVYSSCRSKFGQYMQLYLIGIIEIQNSI